MNDIKYYDDYFEINGKKFPIYITDIDKENYTVSGYWLGKLKNIISESDFSPQVIADIPETECLSVENLQPTSLEITVDLQCMYGINVDLEVFKITRFNTFKINSAYTELWYYLTSKIMPNIDVVKLSKYQHKIEELEKDFE